MAASYDSSVTSVFHNLPLKLLSLILASLVWLFVMSEERSERSYTVQVVVSRVPAGLVVLNEEDQFVEVRVSGPRGILNNLTDKAFVTSLDLAPYGRGELDVPIPREAVQAPKGVTISRIVPATIRVRLDAVVERKIPLLAVTQGRPAHGYEVKEVKLEPSSLPVTGPETLLDKITEIPTTPIPVAGLSGDTTVVANVDFQRRLVTWPGQPIRALVEVIPRIVTRSIPVRAKIEGELDTAFQVAGIEVEPLALDVTGPEPVVERVEGLQTPPINLAGEKKPFARRFQLDPPADGVELSDGDRVTVKVTIEEKSLQRTVPVTATLKGKPHRDYQVGEVQVIPSAVRVKGSYRRVSDLETIATDPIDVSDLQKLAMFHTPLDLPKGVERTGPAGDITVIVPVEDRVVQRPIAVRPAFSGAPKDGLEVDRVDVTPEEVTLTGPARQLRELKGIPTGLLSYPETAGVHVLADARVLVPEGGVTAQPDKVNVTVTLMVAPPVRRHLPVRVTLVDQPAPGFAVREVSVQPKEIEVVGAKSRVEGLSELVTEPISLRGISAETTITTRVVTPPDGVKVAQGDVVVTVRVQREN